MNILNKNLEGCPSLERMLFKLQPFFIEHKNLDIENLSVLRNKLYEEINFIRATKQKTINDINLYFKSLPDTYNSLSSLIDIIPEENNNENEDDNIELKQNMIKSVKVIPKFFIALL